MGGNFIFNDIEQREIESHQKLPLPTHRKDPGLSQFPSRISRSWKKNKSIVSIFFRTKIKNIPICFPYIYMSLGLKEIEMAFDDKGHEAKNIKLLFACRKMA